MPWAAVCVSEDSDPVVNSEDDAKESKNCIAQRMEIFSVS